jgi:hypothetical protein
MYGNAAPGHRRTRIPWPGAAGPWRVNLLAATQRAAQQAMGGIAVRSQIDVRICLRVRECHDVDLILGQAEYCIMTDLTGT